jgi:DNA-binding transcriptional MocR family regulator
VGGLSIWARLPGNTDAGAFTQAALRKCVAVVPGRLLSATGDADARHHVRLAFVLPPDQLTEAIKSLSTIDSPP